METINFVLAILVSYLSLFFGVILARLTKEELKPGEKYFNSFKYIIMIAISAVMLYISAVNRNLFTFGIVFAVSLYLIFSKGEDIYAYALFGYIMYYSSAYVNLFILQSCLVFLYGLPVGTLIAKKHINKEKRFIFKKILLESISYVLIALILFFIF